MPKRWTLAFVGLLLSVLLFSGCFGGSVPGYTLRGVVRDGDGNPLSGAWVYASTNLYRRQVALVGPTGADGRFTIANLRETVTILALHEDWVFDPVPGVAAGDSSMDFAGTPFEALILAAAFYMVPEGDDPHWQPIVIEADGVTGTIDLTGFEDEDVIESGTITVPMPLSLTVTGPELLVDVLNNPRQYLVPGENAFDAIAQLSQYDHLQEGVRVRILRIVENDDFIAITGTAVDLLGREHEVLMTMQIR